MLLYCYPPTHTRAHILHASGERRTLVAEYLKGCGFYSYDAAAVDDDPTSRWIGREVKRFLKEAHQHLPFLLRLGAAPAEAVDAALAEHVNGEPLLLPHLFSLPLQDPSSLPLL